MVYTINGEQLARRTLFPLNASAETLTDYQKMKTIAYKTNMQANFNDIRFTTLDGTNIPYWIESKTDSSTADVWLKIPSISTTTGAKVWMYYGNPNLSSASNGSDTFMFFDDFNDDLSKWTTISGTWGIVTGQLKQTATDESWHGIKTMFGADVGVWEFDIKCGQDGNLFKFMDTTGAAIADSSYSITESVYWDWISLYEQPDTGNFGDQYTLADVTSLHFIKVTRDSSGEMKMYVDGTLRSTATDSTVSGSNYMSFWGYMGNDILDNLRVRKYTATEPTWAADGEEQHQRRVPQFIN